MTKQSDTQEPETAGRIVPVVRPPGLSTDAALAWELIQVGWQIVLVITSENTKAEIRKVVNEKHTTYLSKEKLTLKALRELLQCGAVKRIQQYEINGDIHRIYASA